MDTLYDSASSSGPFNPFATAPTPIDSTIADPEAAASIPSYTSALDAHNYGNQNFAFTDPTTWGTGLENTEKFILGAAYSGLNGFRNTAVTVANWFGADADHYDTYSGLANLDSDVGEYYAAHKSSEDVAGFILGSLIPGLGGVKLLNAGQEILRTA